MLRRRTRPALALVAVAVVAVGLVARFGVPGLGGDLAGSALYTGLLFVLAALVVPRAGGLELAGIAFGLSGVIEVLQLTPVVADVDSAFPPARLVLGSTFAALDFVGYAIGALAAVAVDRAARARRTRWQT